MKKALVVVDYQKDFVSGSLGFPGAEKLDEKIAAKIEENLQSGGDLIFTFDTHGEDYLDTLEGKNLPVLHCVKGSDGWKLYGKTGDYLQKAAAVTEKGAFGSLELGELLKKGQYDEVEFVGLVSSICVISNAVIAKAALPEAQITVDASCTAGADKNLHQEALDVMAGLQIQITNR
ncbi:cysteine hydrolase family protein [Fumia xinanensis]|uniref:nicotinamidase n=1 Tax=Fumia xinanensis TaxID=2763659 RepID=A0A926I6M7_9FIRM|nr:isochorismatase family cysteine hydrolase [Fumia xinanensis]MBC8560055.1 cysteine hydrolase [Fumia xinanensis]